MGAHTCGLREMIGRVRNIYSVSTKVEQEWAVSTKGFGKNPCQRKSLACDMSCTYPTHGVTVIMSPASILEEWITSAGPASSGSKKSKFIGLSFFRAPHVIVSYALYQEKGTCAPVATSRQTNAIQTNYIHNTEIRYGTTQQRAMERPRITNTASAVPGPPGTTVATTSTNAMRGRENYDPLSQPEGVRDVTCRAEGFPARFLACLLTSAAPLPASEFRKYTSQLLCTLAGSTFHAAYISSTYMLRESV